MLGAARWTLVSTLVAASLILPGTASAIVPQVHDYGKFFKPETVAKADAQIKMIAERYKKDVVVETFEKIPDDVKSKFNYDRDTPDVRDRFFRAWRDDLANRAGVNGIVVLISRDQYHDKGTSIRITVAAGGETLKRDFTAHDTEKTWRTSWRTVSPKKCRRPPSRRLAIRRTHLERPTQANRKGCTGR